MLWPVEDTAHRRPPGSEPAIKVSGLVKTYGDVRAVDGVDFEVTPGTVLGLLGPNGAGKTTVVRVLTTLLKPDAGRDRGGRGRRDRRPGARCASTSAWPASTRRSTRA